MDQQDAQKEEDLMRKIVERELDTAFNSFKKRLDQVKHDPDFRIRSKNKVLKRSDG